MTMDASVTMRFARAARSYQAGVALHEAVADALLARLPWPDARDVGRILDLGCGTGVLTERMRRAYPQAHVTAIDAAASMVCGTAERMGADPAFAAVTADVREYRSAQPFDVLASSSALHWMTPLQETAAHLAGMVRPGGHLRVALMIRGTLGELHGLRRRLFADLPPASQLPEADEVTGAFSAARWRLVAVAEHAFRWRYESVETFLGMLHAQGLTGGSVSHGRRLLTRGELRRLTEAYGRDHADPAGGVQATYRVLFMAATR